jgi:2-methylcitrate dehydratase PrpD
MTDTTAPVTAKLAEACQAIRFDSLPPEAVFLAKQCVLDWLGVTLAGWDEPLARILRETALVDGGNPQSTLIGAGRRVTAAQAALVNGAASHALDFDDVHSGMSGHPSVPILPALLALAEWRNSPGRDVLAAFVAGFEMECRIGAYVNPGHYARGFHATGTLGTFGAAAACAHLTGLDREQWLNALAIAGAQAAGLKSMFGTMCKPLHAGKAAANGLLAANLAGRGFTGNPEVLETAQGFAATQSPSASIERALEGLAGRLAIHDVLFKYHAACFGTHETIEAMLRLKAAHGISPEDIDAIVLKVPSGALSMCNIQEPTTALEGKFSLRFTAALALGHGEAGEAAFTDARVRDPRLTAIRDRVSVDGSREGQFIRGTDVCVRLRDGRELEEHIDLSVPATDLEMQWQRLAAKFRSLAMPVLGERQAEEIVSTVARLETLPSIASLISLASGARVAVA